MDDDDGSALAALHAYLKPSNTDASDQFGWSVAVSGDTAIVGARHEESAATQVNGDDTDRSATASGAAFVFVRTEGVWSQQAYLKPANTGATDRFGYSVAISGDTAVVGAFGEDSAETGVNGMGTDNSAQDAGAAYVFVRSGSAWTQQAYLKASNTDVDDRFGASVAVSGDTLVVGAWGEDSASLGVDGDSEDDSFAKSGAAYVFTRSGTTWSQQAYLKASTTGLDDKFGSSVALSGDTLVVGAWGEDSNATGVNGDQENNSAVKSGAAYVFVRAADAWSQQAYLKASNAEAHDRFGYSVSLSGDTVAVGAYWEDGASNSAMDSGAAYVFVRSETTWSQQAYLKAAIPDAGDEFGYSVAVSGETLVVGALLEDSAATGVNGDDGNNSAMDSGAAYVFVRSGSAWFQQAYLKASNSEANDQFGWSVAVSGDLAVVGAFLEDSSARGINGDGANNSAGDSGGAYVYSVPNNNMSGGIVTVTVTGGDVVIEFTGPPNQSFDIEFTTNFDMWNFLKTVVSDGAGVINTMDTGAASETRRFYRVVKTPMAPAP